MTLNTFWKRRATWRSKWKVALSPRMVHWIVYRYRVLSLMNDEEINAVLGGAPSCELVKQYGRITIHSWSAAPIQYQTHFADDTPVSGVCPSCWTNRDHHLKTIGIVEFNKGGIR